MSDPLLMLQIAHSGFECRLRLVTADDWGRPTPAHGGSDIRTVVNHAIGANRRHRMLLHGSSAEASEATRGLDHIGADAVASYLASAAALDAAFREVGALDRVVHHEAGDRTGAQLLNQRVTDVALRTWELAEAIGADDTLDPDVVAYLLATVAEVAVQQRFVSPQIQLLRRLERTPPMTETETFLEEMVPRLLQVDNALHNGNPSLRKEVWSHNEPLTLLGAAVSKTGWKEIEPAFDWVASRFSNYEAADWDVLAAEAIGDLAYLVAIEHTTTSVNGEPTTYSLRATTILRREDGEWKVVLRHADPYDEAGRGARAGMLAS